MLHFNLKMFFKRILKNNSLNKNLLNYNQKINHFSIPMINPKRIIFFVKWNKDFTRCEFIEKKPNLKI